MTTCGRSWKQPDLLPRNKSAPSWDLPTTIGNMSPTSQLLTVPLTDLLKKGQSNAVKWEKPQERAFQTVRTLLTRRPILRLPDPKRTFILRTGASNDGVGAVLMQVHEGKPYPVSYGSKKLTAAERNYSTIEKECLAIVWGVKKFGLHLQGVLFVLQTDHQPLNYLNSAKFINSRVMRWAMYLQNFNIKLECIKLKVLRMWVLIT